MSVNDSGQTVLSGMGELHLEVIYDRLKREYNVDCTLGKLQVSYKEAPTHTVTQDSKSVNFVIFSVHMLFLLFMLLLVVSIDRTIGSKRHSASATIEVRTRLNASSASCLDPVVELAAIGKSPGDGNLNVGNYSTEELTAAVREGALGACVQGGCGYDGTKWGMIMLNRLLAIKKKKFFFNI